MSRIDPQTYVSNWETAAEQGRKALRKRFSRPRRLLAWIKRGMRPEPGPLEDKRRAVLERWEDVLPHHHDANYAQHPSSCAWRFCGCQRCTKRRITDHLRTLRVADRPSR